MHMGSHAFNRSGDSYVRNCVKKSVAFLDFLFMKTHINNLSSVHTYIRMKTYISPTRYSINCTKRGSIQVQWSANAEPTLYNLIYSHRSKKKTLFIAVGIGHTAEFSTTPKRTSFYYYRDFGEHRPHVSSLSINAISNFNFKRKYTMWLSSGLLFISPSSDWILCNKNFETP